MYKHLLRPFAYLTIDDKKKWIVDWIYPLALTIISVLIIVIIKFIAPVALYADGGIVGKILSFTQNLPGFYIAALAAIATFNRVDIDKTMPAPAPKLDIMVRGRTVAIELTRRRFLCSMFAFLTAESIVLIVLSIFSQSFFGGMKKYFNNRYHIFISISFIFFYLLIFWQMIITSFWGLFYLGERLHQPEA